MFSLFSVFIILNITGVNLILFLLSGHRGIVRAIVNRENIASVDSIWPYDNRRQTIMLHCRRNNLHFLAKRS